MAISKRNLRLGWLLGLYCWLVVSSSLLISPVMAAVEQAVTLPEVSVGKLVRLPQLKSDHVPSRPVDVWLPEGYPSAGPYAVLYMHDGQVLFDAKKSWNGQSWQVAETAHQLQQQAQVRPFIVVGIHNIGEARHSEYFPQKPFLSLPEAEQQKLYQLERAPGVTLFAKQVYSDNYLKFLVNELKPYIDQNFATDASRNATFIMGSSMGGLISWYAQTEYPDVFMGAAALSTHWPGTWTLENNPIPDAFLAHLAQHLPAVGQHKWYFDHGDQTLDALYPGLQRRVDQLFLDKGFKAPWWQSEFFPGTDHSEVAWAARLAIPLRFLLAKPTQEQN